MTRICAFPLATLALLACADGAVAQGGGLGAEVTAAPDGRVRFHFAARPDACGNGRSFLQVGQSTLVQNGDGGDASCLPGPVRVDVIKASGVIISLRAFVGPLGDGEPGTDLGGVGTREASSWLLGLAGTLDGRPSHDAIFPATLADSVNLTEPLLDLARDRSRSRQVRTTAASTAAREASRHLSSSPRVRDALVVLARETDEPRWMRSQALSALGRMPEGQGVTALLGLRAAGDLWLGSAVVSALASTDDPRAREELRRLIRDPRTPPVEHREAIRGLGRRYTTGEDAALLRESYPSFAAPESREAAIAVLGEVGGPENVRWLVTVAGRETETTALRTRALRAAVRAGAQPADLGSLDGEADNPQIREAVVTELLRMGNDDAIDRALSLVAGETDTRLKRRLVSRLSRAEHPKVQAFLRSMVER